ncbi:hypothetical protein HC024_13190 [Methylococcaceae bacterium WWC4]|nr:hypothetical protein [Methylococcaceae bacterium WWC4]
MSFDETKAKEMVGKYVLIGVTRLDANRQVLSTEEIHGEVLRVSAEEGLVISQCDGSEFSLPPLLDCYQRADEGVYTLRSGNEKITNPDYLATFNVTATEDDD